ncbi:MAG: BamA/TamA family outer membrane protein, partial [Acidobacteriota bacterium]
EAVPFLTPFIGRSFGTSRLDVVIGYEGLDRPFLATRGLRAMVGGELVGGALGGDVSLARLRGRLRRVLPLDGASRRHLMVVAGGAEAVWPFGTTKKAGLPRFERLFLGGEDDLRGFPVRGVGPRGTGDVVVGGDRLLFASIEYQYVATTDLRLVGFFDLGNVYASDQRGLELPVVRYDAGGELQVRIPVGNLPLRVGYGLNLDRLPDEPRGRFYLALTARL